MRYLTSFLGIFTPALILMSGLLSVVLFVAVKQVRQIRKLTVVSTPPTLLTPQSTPRVQNRRLSKRSNVAHELKATKSIFIVYVAFIIVWLPNTVLHVIFMFTKNFKVPKAIGYIFFDILPVVLTCVNPLIYSFYNSENSN